jgi:hypothetical protein
MVDRNATLTIENAELAFLNFAGRKDQFNEKGESNFCIKLGDELADTMAADGWNVKMLKPDRDTGHQQKYLPVSVKYRDKNGEPTRFPPTAVLITSAGRTSLDEESIQILDYQEIKKVDLIVRPYQYDYLGRQGVKAYLKAIYFTIAEDELALRYRDIPEIGAAATQLALESGNPVHDDDDDIWDADVVQDDTRAIER